MHKFNTVRTGGPHNPNNLSGLFPGWEGRLNGWLDEAEPLLRVGKIAGVYLGDELMGLGVPFSNYSAVADIVAARLRSVGSQAWVYSNECGGPFQEPGYIWSIPELLPASVDSISVDTYAVGAARFHISRVAACPRWKQESSEQALIVGVHWFHL